MHGAFKVGIDHARFSDLLPHIVVDKLAVILRTDAGKALALRLRNAQLFKGAFNIVGHIVPVGIHAAFRADIGHDVVEIQSLG